MFTHIFKGLKAADYANGGQLIIVAKTKEERAIAEKISGATILDSYDKMLEILEGLVPKRK